MEMKCNVRALLANAARQIALRDGETAYELYELADNLAEVMRGNASIESFLSCYSVQPDGVFIWGGLMPGEEGHPAAIETRRDRVQAIADRDRVERNRRKGARDLPSELAAATARADALAGALEPFAKVAAYDRGNSPVLTDADFENARAALNNGAKTDGK